MSLIRRATAAVATVTALGLLPIAQADAAPRVPLSQPIETQRAQLLAQINQMRAGIGAPQLVVDPAIQANAQRWADTLAAQPENGVQIFHNPSYRQELEGGLGCRVSAEVIATQGWSEDWPGRPAPAAPDFAYDGWMHSESHRRAIQHSDLVQVGIGVASYHEVLPWADNSEEITTVAVMEMGNDCRGSVPVAQPTPQSKPRQLLIKRGMRKVRH